MPPLNAPTPSTNLFAGLSRRRAILTGAAALAAPALIGSATRATAATAQKGAGFAPYHRFMLGGFEVATLLAGNRTVPDPQTIFGLNATPEDFAAASQAAFIPVDKAQFFFTPTLVNTGSEVILFDTGLDPAGITAALAAAGYAPGDVDTVVLTHMHPDHIGGLAGDAGLTFGKARYVTGAAEFDFWAKAGNELFDAKVKPLAEKAAFLDDGGAVAPGITAIAAPGHTPGHMGYMVESGGAGLVLIADTANHFLWSVGFPDWEVKFDADKAQAAATRHKVLGMIAADRLPFIGYHMPFPALGYLEAQGPGFRYVPASYQMMLEG